jgi:hypothetical protein
MPIAFRTHGAHIYSLGQHEPFSPSRQRVLAHGTPLAVTTGVRSAVLSSLVSALVVFAAVLKVRRLV